jgi:hypothetical protein
MTSEQIEAAVARSKEEIRADVAAGRVPASVARFSELHDFVDANEYGGLCEGGEWCLDMEAGNAVQSAVDAWLASGGLGRLGTVRRVLSRTDPRGDQLLVQWDGSISGYRFAEPADAIQEGERVVAIGAEPPRRVQP